MKMIICALLLATPVLSAQIDIDEGSVYTSKHDARLTFKQGTFSVESEDEKFDIAPYNVRGSAKGLSDDVVESLLSRGDIYFRLNYEAKILDSNLRLRGGMEKNQQPRGGWELKDQSPQTPYTPGAVQQTWENPGTGKTATVWTNVGGRGPQVKTLAKNAK